MDTPSRLPLADQTPDTLKTFSRDKPRVKLTALLICKLPMILGGLGLFLGGVAKVMGAW